MSPTYRLYYWPNLPGRGEFIRLVLEQAGAKYVDIARQPEAEGGGMPPLMALRYGQGEGQPAYAPPVLRAGDFWLAQTPAICDYLAAIHRLVPTEPQGRARALQVFLTIFDVLGEVHDTHHPISKARFYEDQKQAAKQNATSFLQDRLPNHMAYFDRVLSQAGGAYLLGHTLTYVDLAMYQLLLGLKHAFPKGASQVLTQTPGLSALFDKVAAQPRVAAFKASDRSVAFSNDGIFRNYPELDLDA